jgi:hypothetical protein
VPFASAIAPVVHRGLAPNPTDERMW